MVSHGSNCENRESVVHTEYRVRREASDYIEQPMLHKDYRRLYKCNITAFDTRTLLTTQASRSAMVQP